MLQSVQLDALPKQFTHEDLQVIHFVVIFETDR